MSTLTESRSRRRSEPAEPPGRSPVLLLLAAAALAFACLALPWALPKAAAGAGFLLILARLLPGRAFTRGQVAGGLLLLFALAMIVAPLWLIPAWRAPAALDPGRILAARALGLGLVAVGALWAWLSAAPLKFPEPAPPDRRIGLLPALLFMALFFAWNSRSLLGDLPVDGDESYHIYRVVSLGNVLVDVLRHHRLEVLVFSAAALILAAWPARRFPRLWRLPLILAALVLCFPATPMLLERLTIQLRYPFLSVWVHLLGPVWPSRIYDPALYRIFPLLSVLALGLLFMTRLRAQGGRPAAAFLLALALSFTPVINFLATTLYLEIPALLLFTYAMFDVEALLTEDFDRLRCRPSWIALILVGFLKETLVPVLAAIILLRLAIRVVRLVRERRLTPRALVEEGSFVFCLILPLVLYLAFRMTFNPTRPYPWVLANLRDPAIYRQLGTALVDQFRFLLPLALGGALLAFSRRRFLAYVALLAIAAATALFHFLDFPKYVGYFRFNLFLFPAMAIFALGLIAWLERRGRLLAPLACLACLAFALVRPPVAADGDNAWEARYHHGAAMRWLAAARPGKPLLFDWIQQPTAYWIVRNTRVVPPRYQALPAELDEPSSQTLARAFAAARDGDWPLIVHHQYEYPAPDPALARINGYHTVAAFPGRHRSLVIYEKD